MGILRFILALSVVFHHIPKQPFMLVHGGIAVEAFFIISGFYMAFVINEKYAKTTDPWVLTFYLSRILRLFPAYLLVCAVEFLYYNHSHTPNVFSSHNDVSPQAQAILIFLNLFIVGQDFWQMLIEHSSTHIPNRFIDSTVAFFGVNALNPIYIFIGQAWSLGVELLFYAIAPFVVLSKRRVLIFFVLFLMIRLYFLYDAEAFPNGPWRSRFFASSFPLFFLGGMGYWIYTKAKDLKSSKYIGMGALVTATLALVISIYCCGGAFLFPGAENYDQIGLWCFYIALAVSIPYLFILSKNSVIDGYIGELSYPIYLVHGFIIGQVAARFSQSSNLTILLIVTLVSIVVSIGLYILIDRPVDNFRHKLSKLKYTEKTQSTVQRSALAASLLFIGLIFLIEVKPTPENSQPIKIPRLVLTKGKFNIVQLGDDFYVAKQGTAIDWEDKNLNAIPGLKMYKNLKDAENSLNN